MRHIFKCLMKTNIVTISSGFVLIFQNWHLVKSGVSHDLGQITFVLQFLLLQNYANHNELLEHCHLNELSINSLKKHS